MYNQFTTWGEILPRSFDPQVAATCYSYYPKKVIYSLPQNKELKKDPLLGKVTHQQIQDNINYLQFKNQFNALLYEVRQSRGNNIDFSKNFTNITS